MTLITNLGLHGAEGSDGRVLDGGALAHGGPLGGGGLRGRGPVGHGHRGRVLHRGGRVHGRGRHGAAGELLGDEEGGGQRPRVGQGHVQLLPPAEAGPPLEDAGHGLDGGGVWVGVPADDDEGGGGVGGRGGGVLEGARERRAGAPGLVVVVVDLDGVGGEAEDVAAGEDDLAVGGVVGGVDPAAEGLLALGLDLCLGVEICRSMKWDNFKNRKKYRSVR